MPEKGWMGVRTQETVERTGSGLGTALGSQQTSPRSERGILSTAGGSTAAAPELFSNPLLTTYPVSLTTPDKILHTQPVPHLSDRLRGDVSHESSHRQA